MKKLREIAEDYAVKIADPYIARMFINCFMCTAETTVKWEPDDTCFIVTGDIPAMWLRDSSAQVEHYLKFAAGCPEAYFLIHGLIARQTRYILTDPYANAFNYTADGAGHQEDQTRQSPWLWERKYEIDSLCYPIRLAYRFWKQADTAEHFTAEFLRAIEKIIEVWTLEQNHERSEYYFVRTDCPPSDTLPYDGKGTPTNYTGMTWSGFRPSDDACEYGYLIPSNMFACVVLGYVEEIAGEIYHNPGTARRAEALRAQIQRGINEYGKIWHETYGWIYAYETDGMGNYNCMDDANIPSLLSLPYLEYCEKEEEIYRNTRKFILSPDNPYYYSGREGSGVGSPHTPINHLWPIALCMQALTSDDEAEIQDIIRTLVSTDAGTGLIHESFDVDSSENYTRDWFSWANSLFSELMIRTIDERGGFNEKRKESKLGSKR